MGVWPVRTEVYVTKALQLFKRFDLARPFVLGDFGTLKIWVLVIAIFEARHMEEKIVLIEALEMVSRGEGLGSYEEIRGVLESMFWAGVHDEKLKGLWGEIGEGRFAGQK